MSRVVKSKHTFPLIYKISFYIGRSPCQLVYAHHFGDKLTQCLPSMYIQTLKLALFMKFLLHLFHNVSEFKIGLSGKNGCALIWK